MCIADFIRCIWQTLLDVYDIVYVLTLYIVYVLDVYGGLYYMWMAGITLCSSYEMLLNACYKEHQEGKGRRMVKEDGKCGLCIQGKSVSTK